MPSTGSTGCVMADYSHATERTPADFLLFGLGFVAFMIFLSGVIVASVGATVAGAILLLLIVLAFYARSALTG